MTNQTATFYIEAAPTSHCTHSSPFSLPPHPSPPCVIFASNVGILLLSLSPLYIHRGVSIIALWYHFSWSWASWHSLKLWAQGRRVIAPSQSQRGGPQEWSQFNSTVSDFFLILFFSSTLIRFFFFFFFSVSACQQLSFHFQKAFRFKEVDSQIKKKMFRDFLGGPMGENLPAWRRRHKLHPWAAGRSRILGATKPCTTMSPCPLRTSSRGHRNDSPRATAKSSQPL